jgi:signal transduction histidine kinase
MREFLASRFTLILLAMLAGSFVTGLLLSSYEGQHDEQMLRPVQKNIDRLLSQVDAKASELVNRLAVHSDVHLITDIPYVDFFLVKAGEIVRWTGNEHWPPVRYLADGLPVKYLKSQAGNYLYLRYDVSDSMFLIAAVPIRKNYRIQNEYLQNWDNPSLVGSYRVQFFEPTYPGGLPIQYKGILLCKVGFLSSHRTAGTASGVLSISAFSLSILVFSLLLFRLLRYYITRPAVGFLLLFCGVVGLRFLMLEGGFPARYSSSPLFDPKFFASSAFNPNLGDLLFNSVSVTILCLYLFLTYPRFEGLFGLEKKPVWRVVAFCFSATAVLFGMLFPFVVVQTIYNNSAITLNISESITFNGLRWVALGCVLLSWLSVFMFAHVFLRVLSRENRVLHVTGFMLAGVVLFVAINEFTGQRYLVPLITALVYVAVVVVFRLDRSLGHFRYLTFGYFLFSLFACSSVTYSAVRWLSDHERVNNQAQFAAYLLERDNFGEYLLDEASRKIAADAFIQARISGPFISRDAVRQKVRQFFLPGYFNKYKIDLYLFSGTGEPLDEAAQDNFSTWIGRFNTEASRTEYPGIYFVSPRQGEGGVRYLSVIRISRNDVTTGLLVITLSMRKVIPENVYPELLVDNRFQRPYWWQDYSYAVFQGQDILFSSGVYNYDRFTAFGGAELFSKGIAQDNFHHVAREGDDGRVAVVSARRPSLIYQVADFSFLLICGITLLMLFLLGLGCYNFLRGKRVSLTARIQLILNLSFFLPLIAVSVITLGLTSRSAQQQLNEQYLSKSRNFANELMLQAPEGEALLQTVESQFLQQAKLANLDANVFTPEGHLVVTTQPLIFEYQLLAPVMPPQALARISSGERSFVLQEHVGELKYFVAYSALVGGASGKLIGILAIPYFQSQHSLESTQITILSNILIIFTGVFLLLLMISLVASNWLTQPLSMISQKIGKVSLTASNQPITWPADDEIGLLVRQYNQMLTKLSESKLELERTQRERTWREVAQQVAHEIKNPLTPMKLTLQQLQRVTGKDQSDGFKKAITSLLAQVDALDGIASSFSMFAKMPEPVIERINLVHLVEEVTGLHNQSGQISVETRLTEAFTLADKQLMGRIISNLILNALQAERSGEKITVKVTLEQKNENYLIIVADNGSGIAEPIRDRIFQPHFSTKQSGSGLGLAIARQGMEQMGGAIWFESETGRGTRFYVQLPKK